ncbi:MAG: cation diffusion facilitator family transporter [Geothrix sp.]|uniref:cation diffusion facilitator family transporter n=1 Tax=Geothrix sp. TaxID=1962974 RepID=UPI0017EDD9B7|nr:cation diffusion facilitator family transporter [Geothrix sp.]NWJ41128.1 cation diffusion facilitator family transporter [Geothrix sp.]WIL20882.1 MAG: cation diffusion facilitator family transporter [Geothrix sp.]
MSTGSARAVALALAANGGIALSKFAVFLLTGSSSLLTEAIHSTADCANQVLLFIGMKQGARPPSPRHPLGHGQAAFVASFLVALLLFTVGGLYSLVEGVHKIRHPEQPHHLGWAIGLLLLAIGLEGWSLRGALRAAEPERRGRSLLRYLQRSSSTELVVVLAEDIAALLGLVFALAAVLLTLLTGNPVWDGVGSVAIGLLLIGVAAFVGVEVTSLLMNEAPPLALRAAIRTAVDEDPAVEHVLNLVAVIVGSERLMVALQVKFREQPSGTALVEAINALERRLHECFPQIQHLFVEPDLD